MSVLKVFFSFHFGMSIIGAGNSSNLWLTGLEYRKKSHTSLQSNSTQTYYSTAFILNGNQLQCSSAPTNATPAAKFPCKSATMKKINTVKISSTDLSVCVCVRWEREWPKWSIALVIILQAAVWFRARVFCDQRSVFTSVKFENFFHCKNERPSGSLSLLKGGNILGTCHILN